MLKGKKGNAHLQFPSKTFTLKDGKLLICDTADKIKEVAQTDNFEQAFIRIVKGAAK